MRMRTSFPCCITIWVLAEKARNKTILRAGCRNDGSESAHIPAPDQKTMMPLSKRVQRAEQRDVRDVRDVAAAATAAAPREGESAPT